ncbi:MAG: hypothetical protein R3Y44_02670 [Rikenellaceae bacterium]
MKRLLLLVVVALGALSCFKETGYDTSYILRVWEQTESSADYISLAGAKCYAFAGSKSEWEVTSYESAAAGVVTSIETGAELTAFASSEIYNGDESQLILQLDREEVMLVLVEPSTQVYAYTNYTVPVNYLEIIVDIVFRPWKDSSYTASTWTFIVPESEAEEEETDEEIEDDEIIDDEQIEDDTESTDDQISE